ncbi:hypothetical protein QO179_24200 [Bacillus stercoris]|nr:hypothetical protein [Bacillus stercoris]
MNTYAQNQRVVKQNVYSILEEVEETRNNDKLLLLTYWEKFDGIDFNQNFKEQFVQSSTTSESITRARRSIQASGLFLPTEEEVLRKRRMLAEEARQHHSAN